ncbi:MAG: heme ABC transporter permease CcmC [Alphaproteobacteria bacterium]
MQSSEKKWIKNEQIRDPRGRKIFSSLTPSALLEVVDASANFTWILVLITWTLGLVLALVISPPDYQQGQAMRMLYIHVPASWGALAVYTLMALGSGIFLIWRAPVGDLIANAAAPIGAVFTLISLVTGILWGKPMWGTWWVWDARLTSMLILLLLYGGYLGLRHVFDDPFQAQKPAAYLAIFGWLNVPIIKGSVYWWTTLHQPASIFRAKGPALHPEMLLPLGVMLVAWIALFFGLFRYSFRGVFMESKLLARLTKGAVTSSS